MKTIKIKFTTKITPHELFTGSILEKVEREIREGKTNFELYNSAGKPFCAVTVK